MNKIQKILKDNKQYFVSLLFFILGISTILVYENLNKSYPSVSNSDNFIGQVRKQTSSRLISPLLLGSDSNSLLYDVKFSDTIKNKINEYSEENKNIKISFFMRNLRTGVWSGVDENEHFAPASLMKVPIMIAILKQAETDPNILDKKINFTDTKDYNETEYFKPKRKIEIGKSYSVKELLKYMIVYSDNNATVLLISILDPKKLTDILSDLALPIPSNNTDGTVEYISPKLYSRLFRVLYNSTYLNEDYSSLALELLSYRDFDIGISTSVPESTLVANKFGERSVTNADNKIDHRELHDCGIVYERDSPYLICIMTKGDDFESLTKIIQDLSKITWEKMSS